MQESSFSIEPIGIIRSCFTEKFGIPRQPGLVKHSVGSIHLFPEYGREETVRELSRFSHIWVSFLFHQATREGWRPTVRPPALGGQKRVGVFATRSPHRPNFIGLSAVRLTRIEFIKRCAVLHISGLDMLDRSPVLDIKPYITYSDHRNATGSYPQHHHTITIAFTDEAQNFCKNYQQETNRNIQELLTEIMQQDPRPVNQKNKKASFGILLWDVNTTYTYTSDTTILIEKCNRETDS